MGVSENDRPETIRALIEAGADEFYCGIVPRDWSRKYNYQVSTNRREFKGNNFISFASLEKTVDQVHSHGKEIFVAFNANYYVDKMYAYLFTYFKKLEDMGVDGLIVADLGLILALKKREVGIPLIVSGEAGIYNGEALEFFRKFDVRRVIFPRHLSCAEIEKMVKGCPGPKPEFEAFLKNQRCPFNSNVCTTSHGWAENRFCFFNYDKILSGRITGRDLIAAGTSRKSFQSNPPTTEVRAWVDNCSDYNFMTKINSYIGEDVCGVCAMDRFLEAGVRFFKLVSRGYELDTRVELLRDIRARIKKVQRLKRSARPAASTIGDFCEVGYCCYYRDV